MAKTAKKNRQRNARRAKRLLAAKMRGDEVPSKRRNPEVLAMHLRYRNTQLTETDRKKQASKTACRGRYRGGE